ncbi:UNVERIFIED_CONTAM: hypothetical protein RMT77_018044 [Armadillidium vulgare]
MEKNHFNAKIIKRKFALNNGLLTNPFWSIKVSRIQYKFDPRVGVILEDLIGFQDQTSIKEMKCKNNYSNEEELIFKPKISLRKPFIENHNSSDYLVGEEIALNCSMYMNEKYKPDFKWILPNINATRGLKEFRNRSLSISILKIKNASLSDSGQYVCTVSVLNLLESNTTKNIEIQENVVVKFLDKNESIKNIREVFEGENFIWNLRFEGHTRNLKYTFYNPYGNLFVHKDKRVNVTYSGKGLLRLSIENVTIEDFGNYSVKLEAPNGSYDENNVMLIVLSSLKLQFSEIPSLLPPDKNITITLFITLHKFDEPKPDVICKFAADCLLRIRYCAEFNVSKVNKLEKDIGSLNRYKAFFSLRPSTSGKLLCEFRSSFFYIKEEAYLIVSDKTAPFMVTVHTENAFVNLTRSGTLETINATEGDNISIACFALGFLYFYNSFTSSGKTSVCDTELSLGNCLNIVNISLREDWFFECIALTRITNIIEKISFRIRVDEKITPWVLPSSNVSLEGTEILVKSPSSFFIACYVEGRPKPKITWLKDGENIEEIIENNVEVSLRDDNQILEFKFVRTKYAGKYECSIENRVGHIQPFTNVIIEDEALALSEKNLRISIVSFIIILIISFSVVIFLAIKIKKRKNIRNDMFQFELFLFQEGKAAKLNKECTIEEQAELLPYDHSYEVERENITLGKQLGTGAFGRVLMAQVKGLNGKESPTRVAIKMCKYEGDKTHIRALIKELKIMIHLGKHLNIVNLMGAHTSNIDKGELWILVEYCKYGNLLKFIQRAKAKFINQIDPVTSDIDVGRTSPFPNDPLSPKSLGCSIGYGRTPNLNSDAYLDSHPGVSIEIGQPMGGHSSTTFNTRFTTEKNFFPNSSDAPSGDKHYELPPADPTPRKESSISDSDYDFTYHLFLSSDMTGYSPTPSSPTSPSTSDCQAEPISSDSENIPGVSAPLTTADLLCWAWQVANGMEYLSSRKILHGDLAARNLLLASNNVVKICDFGLSREMYKSYLYLKKSNEMMPIKWMAPEAIEQRIFSIQSDVWSYGVTLWEMLTLGNTPFPGFPLNHLGTALVKGMRLEKPKYCNDQIYNLLLQCWRSNPVERPCFNKIADILSDMLSPNKTKSYVNMNTVYKQMNEEWLSRHEDYLDMVTSPDFQNLQSPMSEEGVIRGPIENLNTEEYIAFLQSQSESRPIVDGGYLDVKFVRKPKTKSRSTLSAPSTQSQGPNNVSERVSEEGEQSLAETSTSLEKSEESSIKRSSIMEQNLPSGDSATVPKNLIG